MGDRHGGIHRHGDAASILDGLDEWMRVDLEAVFAFNRELVAAQDAGRDVSAVVALLDPDPIRYGGVDEAQGLMDEFLRAARGTLHESPHIAGHRRGHGGVVTEGGYASRPSVAISRDGTRLHAWVQWQSGVGETVQALVVPEGAAPGSPVTVGETPADYFRPSAVIDAYGRCWVFYARGLDGHVRTFGRRLEEGRWLAEELVSTSDHPSFNHEVASHADGRVEVVWQGRQPGGFAIFSRVWRDGRWGETRIISDDFGENVWDPSVAALADGGTVYAWTTYHSGSYRVVLRRCDAQGRLGPVRPLTSGTDYALHPGVAVTAAGEVWCAFDFVSVPGHAGSGPTLLQPAGAWENTPARPVEQPGVHCPQECTPEIRASIRVVRVDEDGIYEAEGSLAPGLLISPGGLPRLAADGSGGLTVAYRVLRRLPLMVYYWEVASQSLGRNGWEAPTTYADSDGPLEEVHAVATERGALLSWQTDRRRERGLTWSDGFGSRESVDALQHHGEVIWRSMHGAGTVRCADVDSGGAAAGGVLHRTVVHGDRREEARRWFPVDRERYRTTVAGNELQLYWGDLHRHSLVSRCLVGDEPSLEDFYRYSWDVCQYDFWALTDHAEHTSAYQWWTTQKTADLFRVDGVFVPFYGFEWTGAQGHHNVIYGSVDRGAPIFSARTDSHSTPDQLWASLHAVADTYPAITIPHHPGCSFVPFDWGTNDPAMVRLVEIFQACRGNYEDDGCFRQYNDGTMVGSFTLDGLRRGYRFGLIASSDHGYGASYVGAYADQLSRYAVFDALRSRRTFAATTRDIVLDVRIGDTFMGGELTTSGPIELDAYVQGYCDIARIDVMRNGEMIHSRMPELPLPQGWVSVPLRVEWGHARKPVDCSGTLIVNGGEVLQTKYWSPEITAVTRTSVTWQAIAEYFGEGRGPQRGGVEVTVCGPPHAAIHIQTANGRLSTTLARAQADRVHGDAEGHRLGLQPGTGGLISIGSRNESIRWRDEPGGPAWYYVRAVLEDGEMAWSSPIWVDR